MTSKPADYVSKISTTIPLLPTLTEELLTTKKAHEFTTCDVQYLLSGYKAVPAVENQLVIEHGYKAATEGVGNDVNLRAIIEFSNNCMKDCYYCGIRNTNKGVVRFHLTDDQIISAARQAFERKYPGLLLQAGEIPTKKTVEWLCGMVRRLKQMAKAEYGMDKLRIILSVGELTREQYKQLKEAGADRYLLRIETSDPVLYGKMHPNNAHHSHSTRLRCLKDLDELGYQVASGVLVGVPGQTLTNLARDIVWFRDTKLDMIGLGPYLPAESTPMAGGYNRPQIERDLQCDRDGHGLMSLCQRVIATTRILKPKSNISATTALEALDPNYGRVLGFMAGANVCMPVVTPKDAKKKYSLYKGKAEVTATEEFLFNQIRSVGRNPQVAIPGDPKNYSEKWGTA